MTIHPAHDLRASWKALAALCVGFFMILVDQTIVAVATDAFATQLGASPNQIIWVTSAYLLAFVVPLLVTGRLGDQVGPRKMAIAGLVVFTLASWWCGLSTSVEMLIVARVVQGFGAALLTPQSLTVITRVFPAARRGAAMGVWGAVAGFATVFGPVAGGLLVDSLGWEWIFFVNIPFGALAIVLVLAWVPEMPTHARHFDLVGIALSGVGLFLLVFGIQQGESHSWGPDVWAMIIGGFAVMCVFVWWQSRVRTDPLVPLRIFRDRNFSLGNTSIVTMGFAVAGTMVPFMFYLQQVKGLTAISSGLMLLPMAVLAGLLAPLVGRLSDRFDPRIFTGIGFLSFAVALLWFWAILDADTSIPALLAPITLMGVANGTVWAPNSSTAMRLLDTRVSGAGSGVYNTTRQVGAVLGSAGIGAVMQTRLTATGDISTAVGDAMLLPAALLLLGGLATMFFRTDRAVAGAASAPASSPRN